MIGYAVLAYAVVTDLPQGVWAITLLVFMGLCLMFAASRPGGYP